MVPDAIIATPIAGGQRSDEHRQAGGLRLHEALR